MAALLTRPGKKRGCVPINYRVLDKGRRYRICAMPSGRVLFVMLRHVHSEQALEVGKRRYRELVRLASRVHNVELRDSP